MSVTEKVLNTFNMNVFGSYEKFIEAIEENDPALAAGLNLIPSQSAKYMEDTGWIKMGDGVVFQWGKTSGEQRVRFPILFPNKCVFVLPMVQNDSSNPVICKDIDVKWKGDSAFDFRNPNNMQVAWLAIGC